MSDLAERLTEGVMVHFVMPDKSCRPGTVVRVWRKADGVPQDNGLCNIAVFVDGTNDRDGVNASEDRMVRWRTSIEHGHILSGQGWRELLKPNTWHWIGDHK